MSLWKKKAPGQESAPVPDSGGADAAADVEAVMKKYDRESNVRVWQGAPKLVVRCV